MQRELGAQPLLYSGAPQFNQTINPGFNGPSLPVKYNRKAALGLGITQMIIGIICVILNCVLIAFGLSYLLSIIAYIIWGGILIFVAGLLQVLSAKRAENRCLIIGTMTMTIIATCVRVATIGVSVQTSGAVNFGIGIAMVILAFAEVLVAIVTSVMCCRAVYCTPSSMTPIPAHTVGNQLITLQSNYPGMVIPPGQAPTWGVQSSSQMPFNHYPQVAVNPGLSSNPGQNFNWSEQSSSQMPFNHYPQVAVNPGLSSNPGQNFNWSEQTSSQMPFYPYPQVSGNSGLSSGHGQNFSLSEQTSSQMPFYPYPQVSGNSELPSSPPPTYDNALNLETKGIA